MTMRERRVGLRELRATLSECIRDVKAGRVLVVTDHGAPVARMIPQAAFIRERVDVLVRAGTLAWSGRRLRRSVPVVPLRGPGSVADLVRENRD
jgi:prevent-host-death family protein